MSSTSFKVWDDAPLAHVFFDFFIACGFYHAPSSFCLEYASKDISTRPIVKDYDQ